MDDKPSDKPSPEAAVIAGVTPDMRVAAREKPMGSRHVPVASQKRRRRSHPGTFLGVAAALVGLAGLAASAWVYTEMQREVRRVSTELAQLRLSLDLYAQRNTAAPQAGVPPAATGETSDLADLENRLAILEQNWRSGVSDRPAAAIPPSGPAVAAESDGDCLPSGMRLLVAAGDSYPVCGTGATIEVMNVSNGYISLTDGTTVPSGGTVPLPGTACMIAVTSGGDEATTGFAEIRVTC